MINKYNNFKEAKTNAYPKTINIGFRTAKRANITLNGIVNSKNRNRIASGCELELQKSNKSKKLTASKIESHNVSL